MDIPSVINKSQLPGERISLRDSISLEYDCDRNIKSVQQSRKHWPWKAKTKALLACCMLSIALFVLAVYLIKHHMRGDVIDGTPKEIARVSYDICGNRSLHGCREGSPCPSRKRRLVSGTTSSEDAWPWMAEIIFREKHYCGAVLISLNIIITAAHCVFHNEDRLYPDDLQVRLGSTRRLSTEKNTQLFKISQIHIHPSFEHATLQNDIAIIKIRTQVNLTKSVWPICLFGRDGAKHRRFGIMIGWGKTSYNAQFAATLREALVPIVEIEKCIKSNKGLFDDVNVDHQNNLCVGFGKVGPEYGCNGDSGGPLMVRSHENRWMLIGLMSWGEPKCSSARTNSYTVFTKLYPYLDWIGDVLQRIKD